MNRNKMVCSILGAVTLGSLVASSALAGTCRTRIRNFPTSGTDTTTISCKRGSAAQSVGVASATITPIGTKSISANLTAGQEIQVVGMSSAGVPIFGCVVNDTTPNSSAVTISCNSQNTVKWRGAVVFVE